MVSHFNKKDFTEKFLEQNVSIKLHCGAWEESIENMRKCKEHQKHRGKNCVGLSIL